MLVLQMFSWWYGAGWKYTAKSAWERVIKVSHLFSLPILIRTLFAPWRRIITYPGAGLDAQMRALGDNLVSRVVGFTVRIFVLLTAGLILGLMLIFMVLQIIFWPLVPVIALVAVIKAIIG